MTLVQDRLGPVIALITSLAQGDLNPALPVIDGDPELEAVVLGLQMLAEELAATRAAMAGRSAELEALNNGLRRLSGLGNLLLSCDTSSEGLALSPCS